MDSALVRFQLELIGSLLDGIEGLQEAVDEGAAPGDMTLGKLYDWRDNAQEAITMTIDALNDVAETVGQVVDDIEALWDEDTGLDDLLDSFEFD